MRRASRSRGRIARPAAVRIRRAARPAMFTFPRAMLTLMLTRMFTDVDGCLHLRRLRGVGGVTSRRHGSLEATQRRDRARAKPEGPTTPRARRRPRGPAFPGFAPAFPGIPRPQKPGKARICPGKPVGFRIRAFPGIAPATPVPIVAPAKAGAVATQERCLRQNRPMGRFCESSALAERVGPRFRGGDMMGRLHVSSGNPAARSEAPYPSAFSMRSQIVSSTVRRAWRLSSAATSVQGASPVEVRSNMSLAAVA